MAQKILRGFQSLEGLSFLGNGLGLQFNPLNALNQNSNTPNAYAVVHIMDEEGNVLETHEQFMEHGANSYQKLSLDLEVAHKDAAYAAVFVANESPTDVYFDDLELKHTRLVWQENAYYPFGMGIKPLDYEPEGSSRWKYNGKEHEEATGLIEFEARNHDPMIGRFHGVDPRAEEYHTWSSYVYAGNDPIKFIEVRGEGPWGPWDILGMIISNPISLVNSGVRAAGIAALKEIDRRDYLTGSSIQHNPGGGVKVEGNGGDGETYGIADTESEVGVIEEEYVIAIAKAGGPSNVPLAVGVADNIASMTSGVGEIKSALESSSETKKEVDVKNTEQKSKETKPSGGYTITPIRGAYTDTNNKVHSNVVLGTGLTIRGPNVKEDIWYGEQGLTKDNQKEWIAQKLKDKNQ